MNMLGLLLTSWPRMMVFLRRMVIPNSLQARAKKLMRSLCAVKTASLLSVLSEPYCLLGDVQGFHRLWCEGTHHLFFLTEGVRQQQEENMPKSVEASAQPCFTQLLIWKGSEVEPMKVVKALVNSIKAIYLGQ